MKKIYLSASALLLGSFAFSQINMTTHLPEAKNNVKTKTISNLNFDKAPGQIIWENDFSDAADWVASDLSTSGSGGLWEIGFIPPAGPYAIDTIESTTAANGFAIFDSDLYCSTEQIVTLTTANPVDLSAESEVNIVFESYYRQFQGTPYVGYSTDNTNWTWVAVHQDLTSNSSSNNPSLVSVYADGLAGSATAYIGFKYVGACDYAWMVDDVNISSLSDNDIATSSSLNVATATGYTYYQIPLPQVQPMNSSIEVTNLGSADQTNVQLNATEVNMGLYSSSSAAKTILFGSSDSLVTANPIAPTATGDYQIDYTITQDATDDVPVNNEVASFNFSITDDLYARDNAGDLALDTSVNFSYWTGYDEDPTASDAMEIGNVFEIVDGSVPVTKVEFRIGAGELEPGALVFAQIYDANLDVPVTGGADIGPYIVQAGDENKYASVELNQPLSLPPGEYVVVAGSETQKFSIAASGNSAPQTSFIYYYGEQTWYYVTATPIVRVSFDPTVGLMENEMSNISVSKTFPNPFANATTVQFDLKETANVSYTVTDLAGNVITSANKGNVLAGKHQFEIDGTSFANGIYFLQLKAGNSIVTHKLVVNK